MTDIIPNTSEGGVGEEPRMRAILEAVIDGFVSIDERGTIRMVNPAVERLFGYSAAELIGQNVSLLMPSPHREGHDGYLARYLQTGEKRIIGIGREVVGRRKDGSTFPMDLSVAEANLGTGRVFVGILRDITDRTRYEEALRRNKRELERAVAELEAKNDEIRSMTQQLWQAAKLASVGELAASIAHELNNPLATVSLRVEAVLARTPADDRRRRPLEIIEQETKRMADLVANLLQFSRRGEDQVSTVDIREEVTKSVELIRHHLRKREIEVALDLDPATPIIFADRQKLRQVFLNLLTNAADAMPRGGRLTLRTAPAAAPAGTPAAAPAGTPAALIEVADTGVGVPPEHLEKIMEPFFTTKEEGKGTGLGLAICRRIIQEHRGVISIHSGVNQGTTVRLILPVRDGANAAPLRTGSRPK